MPKTLTYEELGRIMLEQAGEQACLDGYTTTDPYWVGRYAVQYGDIDPDGTTN
jgi:hypothetical protein